MSNGETLEKIKLTVQALLPGARVLLFGSRARGDEDKFSDFDLLIITPETFEPGEKVRWSSKIGKALVKAIHAPVDVLLNSEDEINIKRKLPGHVVKWAIKEGVPL